MRRLRRALGALVKRTPTPTLDALLAAGTVRRDESTRSFVGVASDGQEVTIGSTYDLPGTERYLQANPTPDKW